MINPDDKHERTTTVETGGDEREADERNDIASEERTATRPRSTAEVAKDLDRSGERNRSRDDAATLFPEKEASNFRKRWTEIQSGFVDQPRKSVEEADGLVAEVIKRLADSFAEERSRLEGQWGRGDDVSTEDLRVALQRYRAFFDRLLNV